MKREKTSLFADKEQTKEIVKNSYNQIASLLDQSLRKEFPNSVFEKVYKKSDPYKMEKNPIKIVEHIVIYCANHMT